MNDEVIKISQLKQHVAEFCKERDWDRFHGPKDLAIGAVTEASELLEHFRFLTPEQEKDIFQLEGKRKAIGEELADVLFFLLRFSEKYNFDLTECFQDKMKKNGLKYPADQFRGKNHKYNQPF